MMYQPSLRLTRFLTVGLVVLLLFGTLMPGSWKDSAEQVVSSPLDLAALAHVVLFAAICYLLPRARFWRTRAWHVFGAGLALALLSEGLQFFAVDRHPNVAGVVQDLIGTVLGLAFSQGREALPRGLASRPSASEF